MTMTWQSQLHQQLASRLGDVFLGVNYPPLEVVVARDLGVEEAEILRDVLGGLVPTVRLTCE